MGKSNTCKGKNGFLEEYFSESEALDAADYVNERYGNDVVPYKCRKCDMWHLSPKGRQTPNIRCSECDKDLYPTEAIALRRAKIILEEKGVRLYPYECSFMNGWHLTKNENSW